MCHFENILSWVWDNLFKPNSPPTTNLNSGSPIQWPIYVAPQCSNAHRGSKARICVNKQRFSKQKVVCAIFITRQYLNQSWLILFWSTKYEYENIVCKIASLYRHRNRLTSVIIKMFPTDQWFFKSTYALVQIGTFSWIFADIMPSASFSKTSFLINSPKLALVGEFWIHNHKWYIREEYLIPID